MCTPSIQWLERDENFGRNKQPETVQEENREIKTENQFIVSNLQILLYFFFRRRRCRCRCGIVLTIIKVVKCLRTTTNNGNCGCIARFPHFIVKYRSGIYLKIIIA